MWLPNRDLGGQSDEFVFTVPKLETATELHKVGTARVPGGNLNNSAGLSPKRRPPAVSHTNGVSGRKPDRIEWRRHLTLSCFRQPGGLCIGHENHHSFLELVRQEGSPVNC